MKAIQHLAVLSMLSVVHLLDAQTTVGAQTPKNSKVFHSVDEMVAMVPQDVSFHQARQQNPAVLAPANAALMRDVYQQPATLRVRVAGIANTIPDSYEPGFIVHAAESKISRSGAIIVVSLYLYFPTEAADIVVKMKKGSELVATGVVKRSQFTTSNRDIVLNLDLVHCSVEPK